MKLKFLGTGAAEGIPGMYCHCPICQEIRKRGAAEYHTRSQLLIDDELSIDFPPDAYYRSLALDVDLEKIQTLLVTHSHMDHFYAHDFILRGYKYTSEKDLPLTIYGNAEVMKVFQECTRREMKDCVAPNYTLVEVKPFQPFTFGEGECYTVTPLLARHSKEEQAFVYLIEKGDRAYLHLTDTGRLPQETLDFLEKHFNEKGKKVDFVTFDCTFLRYTAGEVSRHMGLGDNKAMQKEFLRRNIVDGHTRYAITHFSHNGAPLSENLEQIGKEYGYIPSYDGFCVEI